MTSWSTYVLLWRRFALRHWRESPGQSGLLVLILALGVAVYFSIRLANRAATASFRHFTDLVAAESDWILIAPAGDLPESILLELRTRLGAEPVHLVPIVESTATRPPDGTPETIGARTTFRVLGVDLVGIQNLAREASADGGRWFSPASEGPGAGPDAEPFWTALRDPTSVFLSDAMARREGLRPGDRLPLVLNENVVGLRVAGIVPDAADQPAAPPTFLVMDLPALQAWTGRTGWLSRIELRLEDG
ncbi:MAG: ABC transporter permease, partial [Verrucomicrobiales bacterium]|nr:ABC transporter permease [Verrucomicrobiales bacterium]